MWLRFTHGVGHGSFSRELGTQIIGVAVDLCLGDILSVSVNNSAVIAKEKDPAVGKIFGEQLSWPEHAIFGPGFLHLSSETIKKDNASVLSASTSTVICELVHTRPEGYPLERPASVRSEVFQTS